MRILIAIAALTAVAACQQETKIDEAPTEIEAMTPAAPPPTVITITESDARSRIESQGYSNVTGLVQNPDGSWTATGTRESTTTQLSVGPSGVTVVTAPTTP